MTTKIDRRVGPSFLVLDQYRIYYKKMNCQKCHKDVEISIAFDFLDLGAADDNIRLQGAPNKYLKILIEILRVL